MKLIAHPSISSQPETTEPSKVKHFGRFVKLDSLTLRNNDRNHVMLHATLASGHDAAELVLTHEDAEGLREALDVVLGR
jgi:hypothetical protein